MGTETLIREYILGGGTSGSRHVEINCEKDSKFPDRIRYFVTAAGWRDPYGPNRAFGFAKVSDHSRVDAVKKAIEEALKQERECKQDTE